MILSKKTILRFDDGTSISIMFLILVLTSHVLLLRNSPLVWHEINADSFYVINFVNDIVFNGVHPGDWAIAPHFYVFPDMAFAGMIALLIRIGLDAYAATYLVTALAFVSAMAWAIGKPGSPLGSRLLVGATALAAFSLLVESLYQGNPSGSTPHEYTSAAGQIFGPGLHGGAILWLWVGVACSSGRWRGEKNGRRKLDDVALAAIVPLAISDMQAAIWCATPLAFTATLHLIATRDRRVAPTVIAPVLAILASLVVYRFFNPVFNYYATNATKASLHDALASAEATLSMFTENPRYFLPLGCSLWVVARAFPGIWRICSKTSDIWDDLYVTCAGAIALCIITPIAAGVASPGVLRWFIPALVCGGLLALFQLIAAIDEATRAKPLLRYLPASLVICGCLLTVFAQHRTPSVVALARCLAREHLQTGAAEFWDAGPLRAASRWRLNVSPLCPGLLSGYKWLTNVSWVSDLDRVIAHRPSFVVVAASGIAMPTPPAPTRSLLCGGRTILIYE